MAVGIARIASAHHVNAMSFTNRAERPKKKGNNMGTEVDVVKNPADMIQAAVLSGADLEKLKGVLELQERWDATQARKHYARCFASAQSRIKAVVKSKKNSQTNSSYADLSGVIESTQPIYTDEGFAIIFYEGDTKKENHMRICADVLHELGHKETYFLDVPLDGVGIKGNANMTGIHAKASSTSYGRRYLMCMIWNIPTADNDGVTATAFISIQELSAIRDMLIDMGDEKNEATLAKTLGVASLEQLPASSFNRAMAVLEARKAQKEKKAVKK